MNNAKMNDFASVIRESRRRLGVTQVDFAARLGVTANTVARWERGEQLPRTERLVRLGLASLAALADDVRATGDAEDRR